MKNWKDADGKVITNDKLMEWVSKTYNSNNTHELIVGVDSHLHKQTYHFITVVCIYQKGRGGYYYYNRSECSRREFKGAYPVKVKARLFHETTLAIEVATEIQEKTGKTPVVHIDASPPNTSELSSMFSDELRGYVVASGFEAALKPWSFVASGVANNHSKVTYVSNIFKKWYIYW